MRSRRGLIGLLAAQAVSLTGTRMSAIAIPWFVLVSTGSATMTGLVAACEMAPYVLFKALTGPLVDRIGARRVNITGDLVSAVVVGLIPLLHVLSVLSFPLLLVLVAVAGAMRGPSDSAKGVLIPDVVAQAGVPMERATGLSAMVERSASTFGPALAGVIVAMLGPLTALAFDALSFAVSAVIVVATVRSSAAASREPSKSDALPYFQRLKEGFSFLRRDRLLRLIALMVGVTNVLDSAFAAVLVPVWALSHGHSASMVGLLFAAMMAFSALSALVTAAVGHRMPRRATYLIGYLVTGLPRFVVLAIAGAPVWLAVGVFAVSGLASGVLNPILGAVMFERIPRHLLGRVHALTDSLAWAGIPFGPLLGGVLVGLVGLTPVLVGFGIVYLLATTLPAFAREWTELDRPRDDRASVPVSA
ncbi:MFS transporter [Tenggerimyces flavus]|uniref:MFS transporter n=1 Tax=Tenggerimyces flavus TaxID=1708749 RepID=A0ABV7YLX7_9ACTN|nr:MFS transporter [Tenggerimyces flavus]MBM7789449.1 MFS family permease [Tenggerimyces flavus]